MKTLEEMVKYLYIRELKRELKELNNTIESKWFPTVSMSNQARIDWGIGVKQIKDKAKMRKKEIEGLLNENNI